MGDINDNKENIEEESVRLFKIHCKVSGIKANKETYLKWKKEAETCGFDNLAQYIKCLRGENEGKKPNNKKVNVDKFNLKRRSDNLTKWFVLFLFFTSIGVILHEFVPGIIAFIVSVILIITGSVFGLVWLWDFIWYCIDKLIKRIKET